MVLWAARPTVEDWGAGMRRGRDRPAPVDPRVSAAASTGIPRTGPRLWATATRCWWGEENKRRVSRRARRFRRLSGLALRIRVT